MSRTFVSDTARRLNASAHDLAPRLLPYGKRAGHYWQAGDVSGAAGQSLFVHLAGERQGRWQDMATGQGGDMLDLIRIQQGCTLAEAARIGNEMLGEPSPDGNSAPERGDVAVKSAINPDRDMLASAIALWQRTAPIGGTLAEAYLASRGIKVDTLARCGDLRFLADARVKDGDKRYILPALITAVRDQHGQLTGAHRTFLASDGSGKASITNPKRALGRLHGSGAWLAPDGRCLVVAEGIETALSVKAAFPGVGLVAALTAPHMAVLDVPSQFTRILIATDPDVAGLRAAAQLANRLACEGRPARIICPEPDKGDFNDMLMNGGVAAVKALVRSQLKST